MVDVQELIAEAAALPFPTLLTLAIERISEGQGQSAGFRLGGHFGKASNLGPYYGIMQIALGTILCYRESDA
jgi:hypothetical protein